VSINDSCSAFIEKAKKAAECKEKLLKVLAKSRDADPGFVQIIQVCS
jgi:hypothetical protein